MAVAAATAMRFALVPLLGATSPFTLYFPAIVLVAWFGGRGPGLFSTVLSGLVATLLFLVPGYGPGLWDVTATTQLVIFLLAGGLISVLAGSLHRSRKLAQASAAKEREERERFRITLASIGEGVIATDFAGRVTFMNSVAESLTGWPQEEGLGRPLKAILTIIDENTRAPLESPDARGARDGGANQANANTILAARDGTERPIQHSSAPIRGDRGETLGAVLVFRDISESRTVEKERALLAGIVASSEDAIVSKSLRGIIESWNGAAERMFGYTAEEAIGQSITIIIPPERREEEREILARLNIGERIEHFETVRVAKDGRALDISLTVSPVKDGHGRIIGASKIARDITQRKRDERELARLLSSERAARELAEEANRSKDEFVAVISHEIRSPLHAILGWIQLLQTGRLDSAKTARALDTIERSARTQAKLVEDLLDLSRFITGKLKLDVRTVDPAQIVQETVDSIRPAVEARALRLQTRLNAPGTVVTADPARLQQIIWNLLSNAVKFTPRNGLIQVYLNRIDSQIQIVVEDSGKGIESEFLPYVFERFSQANIASAKKHGGLGLGLAIVRHLVELHGGTVRADSPGEGQGSTFTVTIPLALREAAWIPPERPLTGRGVAREKGIQLNGLRILVVDDEAEMGDMLSTLLTQHGAEVSACRSAAEAIELIDQLHPSLLISDIGMPGEDGYSLIRKIRAREKPGQTLQAIALTGFARLEDRLDALDAGFQMYVSKPVEAPELLTVVASLTGRLPRPGKSAA
jgi:PAS domain S-box-containing protein